MHKRAPERGALLAVFVADLHRPCTVPVVAAGDLEAVEGLARVARYAPEFGPGLANHAPMVIEALHRADRSDRIRPFLDTYIPRLVIEEPTQQLEVVPGLDSVAENITGLLGSATHGLLRVAHAHLMHTRILHPETRRELYRAAEFFQAAALPAPGEEPSGNLSLGAALAGVPPRPVRETPSITAAVLTLTGDTSFNMATAAVNAGELSPLSIAAASVEHVLAGAWVHPIVFTHALTAPLGLHQLTREIGEIAMTAGTRTLFRVIAGFAAVFPDSGGRYTGPTWSADQLLDAAIRTGDEHAIKAAVACVDLADLLGERKPLTAATAIVRVLE